MIHEQSSIHSRRWLWIGFALLIGVLSLGVAFTAVSQVSAQSGLITGTVTDPGGGLPPTGTVVHLVNPEGKSFGVATVDPATGNFSLGPVANGNYILQANPPDASPYTPSQPVSVLVTGNSVAVGTVALTNPDVTGMVYAPDGTTPVTAVVNIYKAGYKIQSTMATSGAYQIGGLFTGTFSIQAFPVTDDPYWQTERQPITITPGITQALNLTLNNADIFGTVTDPNGVPVPGAIAHAIGINQHVHRQDTTSASGYFAIGDLVSDTYLLIVEPPMYASGLARSQPVTFTVPATNPDLGTIQLQSAPKTVSGTVTTNTGTPVKNALVIANRLDHPGHQEALTDASGNYTLNLTGGLWSLKVQPTDSSDPAHWLYANPPQLVHFDQDLQPESKTVDFMVLTADSHVTGFVKMPDGTTPPFTVTVSLRNNEGNGRNIHINPTDGSFDIQVPHGNYILHIQPEDPGYAGPAPQEIYAPENDTLDLGTLNLIPRDASITGIIQDSQGNGIGGIRVIGWTRDHIGAQTRTNPDGTYVLAVTAGEWTIKPQIPPDMPFIYTGDPLTATINSNDVITNMNFTLTDANNTIIGQLVDSNGNPVSVSGWAAAGNSDGPINGAPINGGNFTIFVPDGTWQVGIHLAPGSDWLAGAPQTTTLSGGQSITLTFPLIPQNATIAGALWDPRQEIVPTGVKGFVMADNPFTWVSDDINPANGTYRLGVSAGLWRLGYVIDPDSDYVALEHHAVIPVEANQLAGVPLPVVQRDSAISGVVLKPTGQPFPGAVVIAKGIGDRLDQVILRTHTNNNGEFTLRVPYGNYHLYVAGGKTTWLNPAIKTVNVPPNTTLVGVTLQFRNSDVKLQGTTSISGNPSVSGTVHIWAYSDDGAATNTTVALGDTYTLNLLSDTVWHIGAVLETGNSFYATRQIVTMGSSNQTLDLVLEGPFAKPGPVVVTFDSSQPQQVALADGTQIFIPANAMPVSGTVTLHITPIATLPHQHHARLYKYGYAFIATDETGTPITSNFNQNVVIRFTYNENELADLGLSESHLKPAYFSTTTQSWTVPDSYVVDTTNNYVTMQIDHFTDYSLVGDSTTQTFLPVIVR